MREEGQLFYKAILEQKQIINIKNDRIRTWEQIHFS